MNPSEGFRLGTAAPAPSVFGSGSGAAPSVPAAAAGRLSREFTLFGLDFESSQTDTDLTFLSGITGNSVFVDLTP